MRFSHPNPAFRAWATGHRTQPITLTIMADARERLIERRDTHLDQLTDKLREPRVHTVIGELLSGDIDLGATPPSEDDQLYVQDLGLIRTRPQVEIANPIYREIIPRALTWIAQTRIPQETTWYIREAGGIDFPRLLDAFQQFFRENSEIWIKRFDYKEAGPQLLMQAFLQRIVNSGGRIDREYGLGRRRTDLLVQWPLDEHRGFHGPVQRVVVELKLPAQISGGNDRGGSGTDRRLYGPHRRRRRLSGDFRPHPGYPMGEEALCQGRKVR